MQGERIGYLELDQHQQDNILAFTASASEKRSYNEGDPMAFDSVLRNYGDSYDSVTSTFTCSVSGYYLFSMTVMTGKYSPTNQEVLRTVPYQSHIEVKNLKKTKKLFFNSLMCLIQSLMGTMLSRMYTMRYLLHNIMMYRILFMMYMMLYTTYANE